MHVFIAGFWLAAPVSLYPAPTQEDSELLSRLRRFSSIAVVAIPVLIALGAWLAWTLVGGPEKLFGTTYGLLLLAKLAILEGHLAKNKYFGGDAWDMADGMVRQIAWTPRWIPEMQREANLIDRLFYPEKWIFQRHQLSGCDPRQGGIGNMVNCGAAMYIAPVGVVNAADPRAAYDEAIAFASGHQQ